MSQDPVVVGSKSRNKEPSHEKIISLRKVVNPLLKAHFTLQLSTVQLSAVQLSRCTIVVSRTLLVNGEKYYKSF